MQSRMFLKNRAISDQKLQNKRAIIGRSLTDAGRIPVARLTKPEF
jgi:hypothetical protein